jgi:SSS family solute:Na+ symporter
MLLMAVISFFTPKAGEQQLQGLTYFSQTPEQVKETRDSWSAIDIVTSLIVLAACVAFYIYFW